MGTNIGELKIKKKKNYKKIIKNKNKKGSLMLSEKKTSPFLLKIENEPCRIFGV